MLSILLFVTIFLCIAVLYFKSINKNYWRKQNVVQVGDLMIKFMFGKDSVPEILRKIYNEYDEPYVGMTQGTIPTLMLKNPEDIKVVLDGDFQNFHSRGIEPNRNDFLADNLLFINDYNRWKILRHQLGPVFSNSQLKNKFYILNKCSRDFVEYLEDNMHVRRKPFNALYTYTTSSIGASLFGIGMPTNNTMESPFMDMMAWKTLKASRKLSFLIAMASVFPSLFKILHLKFFGQYEKYFVGMVRKVLTYRIYLDIRGYDLMDIFVEIQRHGMMQDFITSYELEPTDEILSAQAMSFFIAGANTTANTMHYTLVELSNNPDILTKLHEEIDKVFEGRSEELTYKDIEKFHYLDKILNETMRKYPPIGIIQRLCSKDTVLPSGVKIAKGNIVLIPVFALHRDKKYYPNPDVFDPERFSSENDLASIFNDFGENDLHTNNYVYLPFGAGNRICFGYRFARIQMKVGLAQILRNFTLVEQNVTPKFERSSFSICSPTTRYEFKFRDVLLNQD